MRFISLLSLIFARIPPFTFNKEYDSVVSSEKINAQSKSLEVTFTFNANYISIDMCAVNIYRYAYTDKAPTNEAFYDVTTLISMNECSKSAAGKSNSIIIAVPQIKLSYFYLCFKVKNSESSVRVMSPTCYGFKDGKLIKIRDIKEILANRTTSLTKYQALHLFHGSEAHPNEMEFTLDPHHLKMFKWSIILCFFIGMVAIFISFLLLNNNIFSRNRKKEGVKERNERNIRLIQEIEEIQSKLY